MRRASGNASDPFDPIALRSRARRASDAGLGASNVCAGGECGASSRDDWKQ
jgi:hypothetical protein